MATENILQRLQRLIRESVRSGRHASQSGLLRSQGLSTGLVGELRKRITADPTAGMTGDTAEKLSRALGVSVQTILTGDSADSELVDVYRERAAAIDAARALKLPEAAIQLVLKEDPGGSPSAMYWFRRIESESERVSPAADSGSFKI